MRPLTVSKFLSQVTQEEGRDFTCLEQILPSHYTTSEHIASIKPLELAKLGVSKDAAELLVTKALSCQVPFTYARSGKRRSESWFGFSFSNNKTVTKQSNGRSDFKRQDSQIEVQNPLKEQLLSDPASHIFEGHIIGDVQQKDELLGLTQAEQRSHSSLQPSQPSLLQASVHTSAAQPPVIDVPALLMRLRKETRQQLQENQCLHAASQDVLTHKISALSQDVGVVHRSLQADLRSMESRIVNVEGQLNKFAALLKLFSEGFWQGYDQARRSAEQTPLQDIQEGAQGQCQCNEPQASIPEDWFQPSATFLGARPGFIFTLGLRGMGYYLDQPWPGQKQCDDPQASNPEGRFQPSPSFCGALPGFVFTIGPRGMGYYPVPARRCCRGEHMDDRKYPGQGPTKP